ncbi:MAG: PLDc N-terminal domain-containing protein [Renibacterium sp.]|nr:PLDc N-terminal domain-containing protein [Renibacterium sp.]
MIFWETIWAIVFFFILVSYLILLFQIVGDLFRNRDQSGFAKALWVFFLLVFPVLAALVYLIIHGDDMAERATKDAISERRAAEAYLREVTRSLSPAEQIAAAKILLDEGGINADEYAALKAKALS